jgi:hypothetical protein
LYSAFAKIVNGSNYTWRKQSYYLPTAKIPATLDILYFLEINRLIPKLKPLQLFPLLKSDVSGSSHEVVPCHTGFSSNAAFLGGFLITHRSPHTHPHLPALCISFFSQLQQLEIVLFCALFVPCLLPFLLLLPQE